MEFICNANFKGEFQKLDLHELHNRIPNSTLHRKPFQLVIKDLHGTLILFSNGKFRIMGCIGELDALFLACSYIENLPDLPTMTLQSYTAKCILGFRVNLEKMSADIASVYEPELFSALRLKAYKPLSVNLFTTGKVMICGLKDVEETHSIVAHLKEICQPYIIRL